MCNIAKKNLYLQLVPRSGKKLIIFLAYLHAKCRHHSSLQVQKVAKMIHVHILSRKILTSSLTVPRKATLFPYGPSRLFKICSRSHPLTWSILPLTHVCLKPALHGEILPATLLAMWKSPRVYCRFFSVISEDL